MSGAEYLEFEVMYLKPEVVCLRQETGYPMYWTFLGAIRGPAHFSQRVCTVSVGDRDEGSGPLVPSVPRLQYQPQVVLRHSYATTLAVLVPDVMGEILFASYP